MKAKIIVSVIVIVVLLCLASCGGNAAYRKLSYEQLLGLEKKQSGLVCGSDIESTCEEEIAWLRSRDSVFAEVKCLDTYCCYEWSNEWGNGTTHSKKYTVSVLEITSVAGTHGDCTLKVGSTVEVKQDYWYDFADYDDYVRYWSGEGAYFADNRLCDIRPGKYRVVPSEGFQYICKYTSTFVPLNPGEKYTCAIVEYNEPDSYFCYGYYFSPVSEDSLLVTTKWCEGFLSETELECASVIKDIVMGEQ